MTLRDLIFEICLGFADDIIVMGQTEDFVSDAIQVVEDWCQKNDMELNKLKCGIIQIRHDKRNPPLTMKEVHGIPIVESYKYLGIQIDSCLKLDIEIKEKQKILGKLEQGFKFLNTGSTDGSTKYQLW